MAAKAAELSWHPVAAAGLITNKITPVLIYLSAKLRAAQTQKSALASEACFVYTSASCNNRLMAHAQMLLTPSSAKHLSN